MRRQLLGKSLRYAALVSTIGLVLVLVVLALWYSVQAITGRYTLSWPQLFGWFGVLTAANMLMLATVWKLRRMLGVVTHIVFILWGGISIWYWMFAPVYYALNINLNTYQLAWTAFAFLWEVPIIGGIIFIAVSVKLFRPIVRVAANQSQSELVHAYQRTVHYPLIIALLLFVLSVIGYVIGGVQLAVFAALPQFELVKSITNGPVVSVFLAVVYYLIFDALLDRYRGYRARLLQQTKLPTRRLRWRIAIVSIAIMLGGVGLLSLLFIDSSQLSVEQQLQVELERDLNVLNQLETRDSSMIDTVLQLLVRGRRGRVMILRPQEPIPIALSPETLKILQQQEQGIVRDAHHDLKFIVFSTDQKTGSRIAVITYITDFYGISRPELVVPYALGGTLIVALSLGILVFVAYRISRSLETLRQFAQDPRPQDWWQLEGVHTRDEIEQVGRTFMRYVQKTADLQHRLQQQVQQLRTDRLSLEHAHARDAAILDSMGEGLIVTDEEGRVMLMNKKAEALLGREIKDVLGELWLAIVKVADDQGKAIPWEDTLFSAVLRTGKQASANNFQYTRSDGSHFPVSVTATALSFKKVTLGVVLVFQDITRAKEIERLKSEFVSLASHQLRTPLTAIKWYLELLIAGRDGILKPEQRRDLKRIERGNERMIQLVNHLLNVSRLESGRLAVNPVPTDLNAFLENIIGDAQAQAVESMCGIILVRDDSEVRIPVDRSLLRQVVENLLANAMKYSSPERDCRVAIRLVSKGKKIIIRVEDHGIGIPQNEQSRVFEKFFRADNATKLVTDGSGLGLYTCKLILETVGCSISFISKEGEGTIFTILIPASGMQGKKGEIGLVGLAK